MADVTIPRPGNLASQAEIASERLQKAALTLWAVAEGTATLEHDELVTLWAHVDLAADYARSLSVALKAVAFGPQETKN